MQRRFILNIVIFSAIIFSTFSIKAFAQVSSSTELINAEILTNIWYSTTTVSENDNISIYAGFQNHSTKNLSLTAGFFVDDIQISKADYVASPKSLIKLETKYTAIRGSHTSQIKILDIAEVGGSTISKLSIENLLSKESEKNTFKVEYKITQEDIINTAKDIADKVSKTTDTVVQVIDVQAEKLATYVESLKEPTGLVSTQSTTKTPAQIAQEKAKGKVLGISTENTSTENGSQNSNTFSITNTLLDALAFVIRHWIWSTIIVVAIVLFFVFK